MHVAHSLKCSFSGLSDMRSSIPESSDDRFPVKAQASGRPRSVPDIMGPQVGEVSPHGDSPPSPWGVGAGDKVWG
jgi:hypothetical protein